MPHTDGPLSLCTLYFTVYPFCNFLIPRVGNSLLGSLLFRSKLLFLKNRSRHSLQKSDCEQITLVTLYKRVTHANRSCCSLKKSDVSDSLLICSVALKNQKIRIFPHVFGSFFIAFQLFKPKSESLPSLFGLSLYSILKSDRRDSLASLFTK